MLFLLFHAGDDRYAVDASQAVEVLPLLQWNRVPHTRPELAGMFNYRGAPLPLIDLTELITNKPSRAWMNTRIIVTKLKESNTGATLVGLLAERVTATLRLPGDAFRSAFGGDQAGYLGPVAIQQSGIIQTIDVDSLFRDDTLRQLQERD
jgi:chemotaxis-related protein WspB